MRFRRLVLCLALGPIACLTHAGCSDGEGVPEQPGPFGHTPEVTSRMQIERLEGPVDVLRDAHGMVHIYATTLADAMRVQGYQLARDRTAQLEIVRRVAEGRMAEVLGGLSADIIDSDIAARTIGLHRVAKEIYDKLPAESKDKALLDAYADGISQFNARLTAEEPSETLPKSMILLPVAAFGPWTGADVLAVARLQSQELSYNGDEEILQSLFIAKWRKTFNAAATDPQFKAREKLIATFAQFAPLDPARVLPAFPEDGSRTQAAPIAPRVQPVQAGRPIGATQRPRVAAPTPAVPMSALDAASGFVAAVQQQRGLFGDHAFVGSNNWVVGPGRAKNKHAILASDPHLSLSAPSVFWMVQIQVTNANKPAENLNVSGLAFPGIPGVILGHNDHVAWGATVANYDVTDIYNETLNADATGVVFNGQSVPFEKIHETIKVANGAPVEYDVLNVPHHGPLAPNIQNHGVVAPDPAKGVVSIKWTGMKPSNELSAVLGFMRAKNVEDARTAIRHFEVGAQNWVFADTNGDIFYSSQSRVPKRDKRAYTWDSQNFTGTLPCFVLPGDGSAEWTGQYLEEANIPHVKNPPSGYVATANNDQVGVTADNDPSNDRLSNNESVFTACYFDTGFREGRIQKRIEAVGDQMTVEEMASIQADARSPMGAELTPKLLEALARAEAERATPGTHPELRAIVAGADYDAALIAEVRDTLTRWGSESDYDAAAGLNLDNNALSTDAREALASKATLIFNTWLLRTAGATFDDELVAIGAEVSAYDTRVVLAKVLRQSNDALFDNLTTTTVTETRDQVLVQSLLDALSFLKGNPKAGPDRNNWRWGTFHTLRFDALLPLWPSLSIPPQDDKTFPDGFPRHGDGFNVDVATYSQRTRDLSKASFRYNHGPTQRFVIEMDPAGPRARNALPGGAIWDDAKDNKHFRDEAELWRRNQNHPVPFQHDEVKAEAESRTVYTSVPTK